MIPENLKKLLQSSNIDDIKIGLSLLPKTELSFRELLTPQHGVKNYVGCIFCKFQKGLILVINGGFIEMEDSAYERIMSYNLPHYHIIY